jgi:flagellar M-ring protein FliF
LDRTVSHTRRPVGRLLHLSVAVLVDNLPQTDAKTKKTALVPLTPEQMAKVESLVKEAVGFEAARGDSVSVQNAAFIGAEAPVLEPLPLWQRPEVRDISRQGVGALIVLILIMAVLRPLLRNLMSTPQRALVAVEQGAGAPGLAGPERGLLGEPVTPAATGAYDQRLALARSAVTQDPKRVAQVVKTWLGEDG